MSSIREYVGKNVEKALEAASAELGLPKEKIKHDVISFGSSGIFGLVGVKKAKIRVTLPKGHRLEGKGHEGERADAETAVSATSAAVQDILSSTFGDAGTTKTETRQEEAPEPPQAASQPAPTHAAQPMDETLTAYGHDILKTIVDYITEDAVIRVDQNDERTIYNVSGGNAAVLIGKRGQTLEAIQYLLEKIINKKNGGRVRVLVDVEGYLDTRKENLERLAVRLAEKAARVGKPMTIGQMNAHDRRIVHLHLKENTEVRTQSIGEGYYRKLMIFPKRRRRGRKYK
ncbi:MAG: RNA-binding cell elongation regulator Jag/EloR [Desulfosarcinaceae bacterium]|nr:RNA-binding cell elongation regulator Jag/EloR [Desulfosarcinaceae bacterium]